jgi:hypothetical protein
MKAKRLYKHARGWLLKTKDGRKVGNAISLGFIFQNGGILYVAKTDFGNILYLTWDELDGMFYHSEPDQPVSTILDWWLDQLKLLFIWR